MSNKKFSLEDLLKDTPANNIDDQDIDSDDLKYQKLKYENERYQEDTRNRKKLAYWAAWVVSIYLVIVLIILVTNNHFIFLSDSVLIALLGTTTMNVLGLMYIVLKGYFKVESKRILTK